MMYYLTKLPARGDYDGCLGGAALRSVGLDSLDHIHALDDGPEDDVLPVEPGGLGGAEEKLCGRRGGGGGGEGREIRRYCSRWILEKTICAMGTHHRLPVGRMRNVRVRPRT